MDILIGIRTSILMCAAVAVSACSEQGPQSPEIRKTPVALKAHATEVKDVEGRVDAYFGETFSEVQKALGSRPPEPEAPSF